MEHLPTDLVFLLTPQHTGTHFARMLLESHSKVSFCVSEHWRIDAERRPGYRLTGRVTGPGRARNEVMLDDEAIRHFHGQALESDFVDSVHYCLSQLLGAPEARTVRDEIERRSRDQFKIIGMQPAAKRPRYLLFQGHSGHKYHYARFDDSRFKFVVTLRHPLLSVISSLRRTNNPDVARDLLHGLAIALSIPNAFFMCVDLWEHEPSRYLDVFGFLALEQEEMPARYVELRPRINETISRDRRPSLLQEPDNRQADDSTLAELQEARHMLLEGRMHPMLREWEHLIHTLGINERMRRFGYPL